MRVKHGHECTASFTLVDQVEHVSCISSEPIKAGHHKLVALTKEVEHRRKLRSPFKAAARPLL